MNDFKCTLIDNQHVSENINILTFSGFKSIEPIAAGNFVEIKIGDNFMPLLRRPYSIHWKKQDCIQIINKIVGVGSKILYEAQKGFKTYILGPLGNHFNSKLPTYDMAVLISGGVGIAPMALLEHSLKSMKKSFVHLIGEKTKKDLILNRISNYHIATDDGSKGYHGTVVDLFRNFLSSRNSQKLKVFSCGSNRMLASLINLCKKENIRTEVSIESIMGCGFGICYGCPVHIMKPGDKAPHLELLCRKGTVLDAQNILLDNHDDS